MERRVRRNEGRDRNGISTFPRLGRPLKNRVISRERATCLFYRAPRLSCVSTVQPANPEKRNRFANRLRGGRRKGGVNLPRRKSVLRGDVAGDFNELTFHWAGRSTKRSTRGKSASMAVKRVARMKGEAGGPIRKGEEFFRELLISSALPSVPWPRRYEKKKNDLLINLTSTARESKGFSNASLRARTRSSLISSSSLTINWQ